MIFIMFQVSRSNFPSFCSQNLIIQPDEESDDYPRNILAMKEEAAIMSMKGTIRGMRNKVKTGIKTFLQDQSKKVSPGKLSRYPSLTLFLKSYVSTEEGVCVVFVTSLGIVRDTRARCSSVRKIFRNLCVRWVVGGTVNIMPTLSQIFPNLDKSYSTIYTTNSRVRNYH